MANNLSLPLQPLMICWGMWLDAAFYYRNNFDKVEEVVNTYDENDRRSIQLVQE